MDIKQILDYVRRTNPDITEEKLVKELSVNGYASRSLIMTAENNTCKNVRDMILLLYNLIYSTSYP